MNRVFSQVSEPEYIIYKAVESRNQHVGIVICPGGGFRDVWFDREGVDFALWLADKGITSLVLKYRTFNKDADGFKLERDKFNPEVYADAKQAIYILKSKADELGIDTNKIGIGGFFGGWCSFAYGNARNISRSLARICRTYKKYSSRFCMFNLSRNCRSFL